MEPFAQTHAVSEVEYPSHASGDTGLRAADQERLEPAGPVARRGGVSGSPPMSPLNIVHLCLIALLLSALALSLPVAEPQDLSLMLPRR